MNATFSTAQGKTFNLHINVYAIKDVKDRTGTDLGKLLNPGNTNLQSLLEDPAQLCDVLFVLCEEQANNYNMTDRQFGEAMFGDTFEQAAEAFMVAYASFCPAHQREILMKSLEMGKSQMEQQKIEALEQLEHLDIRELTSTRPA